MTPELGLDEVRTISDRMLNEVERAVVGKRDALELVLLGLLADGHVLIEDYPGLAKTLVARSFAQVASMSFSRIQFTPDLMPSDVTGSSIYNQRTSDFEFSPGPIFANLLLADEINRAPPKTQAALLEAMQERQVTIDGRTRTARAPVPRARDAEPDRVRGHLPAARGAARPLPAADRDRLSRPRAGVDGAGAPRRAQAGRGRPRRDRRRAHARRDAARDRGGLRLRERRPLHGRRRRGDARQRAHRGRREPARVARAVQARALPRGAARPRLRAPRRREGDRRARARPPADAQAGALGAARAARGGRRPTCSRPSPTPAAEDRAPIGE